MKNRFSENIYSKILSCPKSSHPDNPSKKYIKKEKKRRKNEREERGKIKKK